MLIKRIIHKIHHSLQREIKTPVYIPVIQGEYLKDKIIFITGGTSGIGYAIAKACLKNGAKVIITGRNQERLDNACKKLSDITGLSNDSIRGLEFDVGNISLIGKKLEEALSYYPGHRIDVLVNNAGILSGDNLGDTKEEDYDRILQTNLKGTYFLSQEFANYLVKNSLKGNILNISSSSGIRPAISPYMVSKWGINGLTKGLAKKYIKHGIVVNAIAPGPTATGMLIQDRENINHNSSPAGRYAMPEEIANMAVFLISDMGRMIVGDTINITGGCANLTYDDIAY